MVATQLLSVDPIHPDDALLAIAAHALRQGALVAFPTETVYGLGVAAKRRLRDISLPCGCWSR